MPNGKAGREGRNGILPQVIVDSTAWHASSLQTPLNPIVREQPTLLLQKDIYSTYVLSVSSRLAAVRTSARSFVLGCTWFFSYLIHRASVATIRHEDAPSLQAKPERERRDCRPEREPIRLPRDLTG